MPVVIPIIAAFATGAVGAVIAGTATFAEFAVVAGAVLSTAGALTNNKDLERIGGFVGLAGGIANLAGSLGNSASTVDAAGIGSDAAQHGFSAGADTGIVPAGSAADAAAQAGAGASDAGNGLTNTAQGGASGAYVPPGGITDAATPSVSPTAPASPTPISNTGPQSIQDLATTQSAGTQGSGAYTTSDGSLGASTDQTLPVGASVSGPQVPSVPSPSTPVGNLSQQFSSSDLSSWWNKAVNAGKGIAQYAKDNQALTNGVLGAINGAYGPNAQALKYQQSLNDIARRNINSPVPLQYTPKGN